MFKKVMVAVDLTRSGPAAAAVETAARLAAIGGGELVFVSVRAGAEAEDAEAFRARLEAFAAAEHAKHGLGGGWLALVDDDVDDGLRTAVEKLAPDLVVVGAHEPGFLEFFTGPTVRDFVADCAVPLLIAR